MQTTHARTIVSIDLIGDLDATLGSIFADTLTGLIAAGTTDVIVMTKHVALSSVEGLGVVDAALSAARAEGCSVRLEPGSRRMKAALTAARMAFDRDDVDRPRSTRHLMIARHAARPQLKRTA
jgi:anti-anti-sigma regulatory factor